MSVGSYGKNLMALVLAVACVSACGDAEQGPDPQVALLAGTYAAEAPFGAVVFTSTGPEGTEDVDWLARGASIRLVLLEDMTTSGRLFVPGADEGGGDIDEDLTGTWSLFGDKISLEHEADTFLRDMDLLIDGDRLEGERAFGEVTIRVELLRR